MLALTGCIAFKHYSLHVVVQHSARDTAEIFECVTMAPDEGLGFHVGDEFDKTHPAKAQRGAKGMERALPFAKFDPVNSGINSC